MATQDLLNQWLAEGIKAAQARDIRKARSLLYQVLDSDPRSEIAWLWLSAVVDNDEDRRICLENVLTLNPRNTYAQRGLKKLRNSTSPTSLAMPPPAAAPASHGAATAPIRTVRASDRPATLWLLTAFWTGLSLLFLVGGLIGLVEWALGWLRSRLPLSNLHPSQIIDLLVVVIFLIAGVMAINIAWALFSRHRSGFYGSLILALGLLLVGPTSGLLLDPPNLFVSIFLGAMLAIVVLLTLASLPSFEDKRADERTLVPKAR